MIESPKEVCEYRKEWKPQGVSECRPCHVEINDAGCFQCSDCLTQFDGVPGQIKKCLKEMKGEFWEIEYKKLLKLQTLVRKDRVGELRLNHYSYYDNNGIIVNERGFYEFIT